MDEGLSVTETRATIKINYQKLQNFIFGVIGRKRKNRKLHLLRHNETNATGENA